MDDKITITNPIDLGFTYIEEWDEYTYAIECDTIIGLSLDKGKEIFKDLFSDKRFGGILFNCSDKSRMYLLYEPLNPSIYDDYIKKLREQINIMEDVIKSYEKQVGELPEDEIKEEDDEE